MVMDTRIRELHLVAVWVPDKYNLAKSFIIAKMHVLTISTCYKLHKYVQALTLKN